MSGHRRCSCILHLRHSVTHRFLLGEACNDFLRGECALGSDCKFAHPVEDDDDFSVGSEDEDEEGASDRPWRHECETLFHVRRPLDNDEIVQLLAKHGVTVV